MTKHQRLFYAGSHYLKPGWLSQYLDRFASELAASGYTEATILGYANSIAHFAEWTQSKGFTIKEINSDTVDKFARHRCRCPGGRRLDRISRKYARRVGRFIRYLELQGIIQPCRRTAPPSLPKFRNWLVEHRGAAKRTVEHYEGLLVKVLPAAGQVVTHFTAEQVRALVLEQAQRYSAAQVRCIVNALRAYLRFLVATGCCQPGIDESIPKIPQWRLSALPRYLSPDEVTRVIASCNTLTAVGLRDQAILLLLARLGLRGGDIVKMRFDDIDWPQATLKVCGKGHREVRLPLPQDAGDAVLAYLKQVRPRVPIERLFLCMQAPYRSLPNSGTVSSIVSAALHRAGVINPPSRGANLLRHSAATAMLRAGASLEVIGSMLRHRSVDTTAHYAKVDIAMLEQVVQPWPEGVSC